MTLKEYSEIKRNEFIILSKRYLEAGEFFLAEYEYYEDLAREMGEEAK